MEQALGWCTDRAPDRRLLCRGRSRSIGPGCLGAMPSVRPATLLQVRYPKPPFHRWLLTSLSLSLSSSSELCRDLDIPFHRIQCSGSVSASSRLPVPSEHSKEEEEEEACRPPRHYSRRFRDAVQRAFKLALSLSMPLCKDFECAECLLGRSWSIRCGCCNVLVGPQSTSLVAESQVWRSTEGTMLHWGVHVFCSQRCHDQWLHQEQCLSCARCGLAPRPATAPSSAAFKSCARCRAVRYCSRSCQVAHWQAGHKESCSPHQDV